MTQRDAFWTRIYEIASEDRDVIVISADMGASALDDFRKDIPGQFINAGIAEQNAIVIGSGLALSGKKVLVYAIAPFIALRCLEQVRVNNSMMKIPLTVVGVGAGFGYEDSGPTHHMLEDITVMRAFPNVILHGITDSVMARAAADLTCTGEGTHYIRLDRQFLPSLYKEGDGFSDGLCVLKESSSGTFLVGTGVSTHMALALAAGLARQGRDVGVIDLYRLPVNEKGFAETVKDAKLLITLEEHFLPGGLGGAVCEALQDSGLLIPVKRFGLGHQDGYCYVYGGRDVIRGYYGFAESQLLEKVGALLRRYPGETPRLKFPMWSGK